MQGSVDPCTPLGEGGLPKPLPFEANLFISSLRKIAIIRFVRCLWKLSLF